MADPVPIPFGEWTPDNPARRSGASEARGVASIGGNYAPLKDVLSYSDDATTDAACLGCKGVYDDDGDAQIFMGDASKLYWLDARAATDVSKVGGYSVGADKWWMFEQFGDFVVAVAPATAPQVYEINSSSAFADLGGSPPQFTCVARVNDFLMGGLNTTVTWSAFNDITDWTADPATQAGAQTLDQAHGIIQTIIGGEYAAIFQERAIRRAIYVGPPVIWDFGQDAVELARGCVGPFAAAKFGRMIFYAADDGFYAFDGNASTPIGAGKVDDYFVRNLNYAYRQRVFCAVDTINKLVVWGCPMGSATNVSELLIYSVTDGRWTHDVINLELLTSMPVEALTVDSFHLYETSDDLDTSNLDAFTIDSAVFDDKRKLLAGVSTAHNLQMFSGSNRQAIIETAEFEPAPGRRAQVTEIWPIGNFEQANVSASVGYRSALPGETVRYTNAASMNRAGFCPVRADGRFLRGRIQVAAGGSWTRLEGINATSVLTGGR